MRTPLAEARVVDVGELGRPALTVYTDRDGLSQITITALAFDREGYLWVGTEDGAVCYNGRTWRHVDMPNRALSNRVQTLLASSDGSLWFGTLGGGLVRRQDGQWTTFDTSSTAGGLPDNDILSLLETVGEDGTRTLWVGTAGGGLARLEHDAWTVFDEDTGLPDDEVWALLETVGDSGAPSLWAGTDGGLARFENGHWTTFDENSGLPGNYVQCLLETVGVDGTPGMWVGTKGGLARFERGGWAVESESLSTGDRRESPGFPKDEVRCLLETVSEDGTPTLWVGTQDGLARLELGKWTVYDSSSGLPNSSVRSLLASRTEHGAGTIFVGTVAGLAKLEPRQWTSFDSSSMFRATGIRGTGRLSSNSVQSLLETVDETGAPTLWVGTQNGLARFESGRWTSYDERSGLPDESVSSIAQSVGEDGSRALWVGTQGGLSRFDRRSWQTFDDETSDLPDNHVWTVLETRADDGTRTLWVGTQGGLARYERGIWTAFDTISTVGGRSDPPGLLDYAARSLLETRDNDGTRALWVGTTGGLARLEKDTWTLFDTSTGLPNNAVLSLLRTASEGTQALWAGTHGGGVARLNLNDDQAHWVTLSDESSPSLHSSTVHSMCEDRQGRVYLGTNTGVMRLNPRTPTPDNASEFSIQTFTTDNGLPSNACNDLASIVDSRGRVWIGTVAGVAMFDPSTEYVDRARKPLYIEIARAHDDDGNERPLLQDESLDYDENNLEFECALLSYVREGETRYRTQLLGIDRAPSNWSSENRRVYTNLREGDYTFKVWGSDAAGNVSGPVELAFVVRAAPWRTWWAYLFYVGMLVGTVSGVAQWRLRAVSRRNEFLEATIAEQTAELGRRVRQLEVSEVQAHESEARASEANRAKSIFLSNMSHELRTPLNAVLGYSQLMSRDVDRSAQDRERLATIHRSGEYLLGLINDVLSIARIEAGKLTLAEHVFDLRVLLEGLREMIRVRAEAKGLRLVFFLDSSLPRAVRGDSNKLQQVLANLLGNAVKFTGDGSVTLRASWEQGRARFEVQDTGPGIAVEELGQLFEPFVQATGGHTAGEGAGLGLAISRSLAVLMGGEIRVHSQPGKGATFRLDLVLPSADETELPAKRRRVIGLVQQEGGPKAYRILVADDSPENRALLREMLGSVGMEVREASDGKEAVEVWTAWRPHVIWMDQRMPVMDGRTATQAIRAAEKDETAGREAACDETAKYGSARTIESPGRETIAADPCKIIALTAGAFDHEKAQILEAGCDDLVTKPFLEETIFDKVAEHLGVRFLYEEGDREQEPRNGEPVLTLVRLGAVPADWIADLRRAVAIGDDLAALQIVDRIEERDASLAEELRRRIRGLQFDVIVGLLDGTSK